MPRPFWSNGLFAWESPMAKDVATFNTGMGGGGVGGPDISSILAIALCMSFMGI